MGAVSSGTGTLWQLLVPFFLSPGSSNEDFQRLHPSRKISSPLSGPLWADLLCHNALHPPLCLLSFGHPCGGTSTSHLPPCGSTPGSASLMGPHYSHLLEEARSLSKQDGSGLSTPGEPSTSAGPASDDELTTGTTSCSIPVHSVQQEVVPQTPSMGSRMKGFFFSYLPTLKKKTPVQKTHEPMG